MADKLMSLHITNSDYMKVPSYSYEALRKGITCLKCNSFSIYIKGEKCICEQCEYKEIISAAIMRAVREFQLLFPEKKVTTADIYDWCQMVKAKKTIRKVLMKNFEAVGENRWIYFK